MQAGIYNSSIDEIRKFMVCFSIDIIEKQLISFQKHNQVIHARLECASIASEAQRITTMLDNSPVELLHMKNNKSML